MDDLRSTLYIQDNNKFYGGTLVKYIGPESERGILDRNKIYTVDNFLDLRDRSGPTKRTSHIRGRLLIQIKLPNGQKTCYVAANNFKKV